MLRHQEDQVTQGREHRSSVEVGGDGAAWFDVGLGCLWIQASFGVESASAIAQSSAGRGLARRGYKGAMVQF